MDLIIPLKSMENIMILTICSCVVGPSNSQWQKNVSLPITSRQILDSSKLKEFLDDNFKFDENGRKLSKKVENTVGKREIVRYEQFLLFPQCFQKTCFPGASKGVIVWEWVKIHEAKSKQDLSTFNLVLK